MTEPTRRELPTGDGDGADVAPAGAHGGSPDHLASHDDVVRLLSEAAIEPVVALLELLAGTAGPRARRATPGVPRVVDLVEFTQAHRWQEPVLVARLAVAITELGGRPPRGSS